MLRLILCSVFVLGLSVPAALADDDDVSKEAQAKIEAVLKEAGCSGGEIEKKKYGYKVEEAECGEDEYDIKLDAEFKITEKEKE